MSEGLDFLPSFNPFFFMSKFESEKYPHGKDKLVPDRTPEKDRKLPTVSFEDVRFIQNTGGHYRGFVETPSGRRFNDFQVGRRAYYDSARREVIETFVESSAGDGETDELAEPREVRGFEIMIVKRDISAHEIADPAFIDLYPENFPDRPVSLRELNELAQEIHDYVLENADKSLVEIIQSAKASLRLRGWKEKASSNMI